MTTADTPELIAPDRGLDAAADSYPLVVRGVVLSPFDAEPTDQPSEAVQLSARTVGALNEVAFWANDGQSADPTACAWLAYLRWAVACGARLPGGAPHPPADDFDRDHPVLAGPGRPEGDSCTALATGALGEVARPVLPLAASPEVLARSAPYGLLPAIGWKSLVALTVDSAAITHGSPEAQTAAAGMALAVHAAAQAAQKQTTGIRVSVDHVVSETTRVCALITRPAPVTNDLLQRCRDRAARDALLDAAGAGTLAPEPEHAASYALALGLAALVATEEGTAPLPGHDAAHRAHERLPGADPVARAARTVATTVAAARWPREEEGTRHHESGGDDAVSPAGARVRAELEQLAREWMARWRP